MSILICEFLRRLLADVLGKFIDIGVNLLFNGSRRCECVRCKFVSVGVYCYFLDVMVSGRAVRLAGFRVMSRDKTVMAFTGCLAQHALHGKFDNGRAGKCVGERAPSAAASSYLSFEPLRLLKSSVCISLDLNIFRISGQLL